MKQQEAIKYLETLEKGNCITVNIPLMGNENIPITAMYVGKDHDNRYIFLDMGKFVLTKDFIEKGKITIDKEFDNKKAREIYSKVKLKKKIK